MLLELWLAKPIFMSAQNKNVIFTRTACDFSTIKQRNVFILFHCAYTSVWFWANWIGIKCFDSRSAFFKLYDEDDASSDSSDESEARTINDYVTVPTATSTNQSSSISPNLTGANSAGLYYVTMFVL